MDEQKPKKESTHPSLLKVIGFSLCSAVVAGAVYWGHISHTIDTGRNYAIKQFGDKKAPLTQAEEDDWYRYMRATPREPIDLKLVYRYNEERRSLE